MTRVKSPWSHAVLLVRKLTSGQFARWWWFGEFGSPGIFAVCLEVKERVCSWARACVCTVCLLKLYVVCACVRFRTLRLMCAFDYRISYSYMLNWWCRLQYLQYSNDPVLFKYNWLNTINLQFNFDKLLLYITKTRFWGKKKWFTKLSN